MDEQQWNDAAWTDEFQDIEGDAKPKPRFSTRAKMLWDDRYFYIAAKMLEPHVWGTLTKHDSVIFRDNDFEVFIDPDGDTHNYYEFEMNALNTGWDLFLNRPYKNQGKADNSWEIPGLKTAVYVDGTLNDPSDTDKFWSVEIAIPWKVLAEHAAKPSPPKQGDQWRVNFSRVEWHATAENGKYVKTPKLREDNWVWSPQGIIDMHRPERWGYVQFSTKKPGTDRFHPDEALPAKNALMTIYHAGKAHHQKHKHWPPKWDDFQINSKSFPKLAGPISIETSKTGFTAKATIQVKGKLQTWVVQHDSRLFQP